jgi:hypothetical protein
MQKVQQDIGKMLGAHVTGIDHSYKKINKTPAKCLVCGEYSECQIIQYQEASHIFFIKTKILNEQFWFDWAKCNHRAILFEKNDVARYKKEQIETGTMTVPYYQGMKLHMTSMPKKVPTIQIILVVLASVIVGVLLKLLLDYLGIPFVP